VKCGEKTGHQTKQGQLCQQNIAASAPGCFWFIRSPEERRTEALKNSLKGMRESGLMRPEPGTRYESIQSLSRVVDETIVELRRNRRKPATATAILQAVDRKLKITELRLLAYGLGVGIDDEGPPNGTAKSLPLPEPLTNGRA
jgi:hypothetical protein